MTACAPTPVDERADAHHDGNLDNPGRRFRPTVLANHTAEAAATTSTAGVRAPTPVSAQTDSDRTDSSAGLLEQTGAADFPALHAAASAHTRERRGRVPASPQPGRTAGDLIQFAEKFDQPRRQQQEQL